MMMILWLIASLQSVVALWPARSSTLPRAPRTATVLRAAGDAMPTATARLKQLLQDATADIVALHEQNATYKAELDMRRTVMGDD